MHDAISPLDGRYASKVGHLSRYFSEMALMRMRIIVELRFLRALDGTNLFPKLTANELKRISQVESGFDKKAYRDIKEIEQTINHDVKACEIYLRKKLDLKNPNMIHFGLTSEDVNNLAHTFLLKEYLKEQQLPQLEQLIRSLTGLAAPWSNKPFPARTHGQMASPTTAGKEMAVFISRLLRIYQQLKSFRFRGKLNGATGNFSALLAVFPEYDWLSFSRKFLEEHDLEANLVTTQIEDHDTWVSYFGLIRQLNNIVLDLDRDIWLYLTLGYLHISADAGAVGSSTMPHKVNPINFENSEGNMQLSSALLNGLSDKLGSSRLQRDLSDSTVERNMGVALAHSYLAVSETLKGLSRLHLNEKYCLAELEAHPELLAEPVQTILRRYGVDDPYSLLKDITRGKQVSLEQLRSFIEELPIKSEVKMRLNKLTVASYIGDAARICNRVIKQVEETL